MKKFIFAFVAMVVGLCPAMAQDIETIADNTLYTVDATAKPGEQVVISVQMKNSHPVQSIGLYFTLSDGLTVAKSARGLYLITLSDERTDSELHSLSKSYVTEYRVAILQQTGLPFEGTSGEVFTVTVDVPEDMPEGDYEIRLYNVELSGIDALENGKYLNWKTPFTEYTGKITVINPTAVAEVSAENGDAVEIYSVNGVRQSSLQPGLNVVKNVKTGDAKTVVVK